MKTVKVTRAQHKVLQQLSRRDINTIRKHPQLVSAAKDLVKACRKVIKRVEGLSEYANRRKRRTAYKKIISVCERAITRAGR